MRSLCLTHKSILLFSLLLFVGNPLAFAVRGREVEKSRSIDVLREVEPKHENRCRFILQAKLVKFRTICPQLHANYDQLEEDLQKIDSSLAKNKNLDLGLKAKEVSAEELYSYQCAVYDNIQSGLTSLRAQLKAADKVSAKLAGQKGWVNAMRERMEAVNKKRPKMECYIACCEKNRTQFNNDSCAKPCGLEDGQVNHRWFVDVAKASPRLMAFFIESSEHDLKVLEERQKSLSTHVESLSLDLRDGMAKFEPMKKQYEEKFTCAKEQAVLTERVSEASRKIHATRFGVYGVRSEGSGTYVAFEKVNNEKAEAFVTAEHVANTDLGESDAIPLGRAGTEGSTESAHLALMTARGLFDKEIPPQKIGAEMNAANDAAYLDVAGDSALSVAKAGARPDIGQKVLITGFPAGNEGFFSSYTCTVEGYSSFLVMSAPQYILNCPNVLDQVGGISGGAAVDMQGTYLGAITAQYVYHPTDIRVAPVNADPAKGLQIEPISMGQCLLDIGYNCWMP